ncbi:hypothetical protein NEOKW01_0792 [Nematocida sp. AWRm80]|nr:hypothetical protein NEOKW01_0792 [Nematocida sp. AWRm80]
MISKQLRNTNKNVFLAVVILTILIFNTIQCTEKKNVLEVVKEYKDNLKEKQAIQDAVRREVRKLQRNHDSLFLSNKDHQYSLAVNNMINDKIFDVLMKEVTTMAALNIPISGLDYFLSVEDALTNQPKLVSQTLYYYSNWQIFFVSAVVPYYPFINTLNNLLVSIENISVQKKDKENEKLYKQYKNVLKGIRKSLQVDLDKAAKTNKISKLMQTQWKDYKKDKKAQIKTLTSLVDKKTSYIDKLYMIKFITGIMLSFTKNKESILTPGRNMLIGLNTSLSHLDTSKLALETDEICKEIEKELYNHVATLRESYWKYLEYSKMGIKLDNVSTVIVEIPSFNGLVYLNTVLAIYYNLYHRIAKIYSEQKPDKIAIPCVILRMNQNDTSESAKELNENAKIAMLINIISYLDVDYPEIVLQGFDIGETSFDKVYEYARVGISIEHYREMYRCLRGYFCKEPSEKAIDSPQKIEAKEIETNKENRNVMV